jgi:hypothetical protein
VKNKSFQETFVRTYVAEPMRSAPVKIAVLVAFAALTVCGIYGCTQVAQTTPLVYSVRAELTALLKMDTKCTTPSPIPTVNGNTVRSFSTHGQQSAAQVEAQPLSHALTSD